MIHHLGTSAAEDVSDQVFRQAKGQLAVWLWTTRYWFRLKWAGRCVAALLILTWLIEVGVNIFHLSTAGRGATRADFIVFSLSTSAIALMIAHHSRLQFRVSRHQILLNSTAISVDYVSRQGAVTQNDRRKGVQQHAEVLLNGLVFSLNQRRKNGRIAASILLKEDAEGDFSIFAQDGERVFAADRSVDGQRSAAGFAAMDTESALIYLPATEHKHAVRLSLRKAQGSSRYEATSELLTGVFQENGSQTEEELEALASLLCVRIPIESPHAGRYGVAGSAVLSISSSRKNEFGELEFNAAKLHAALIADAMRHLNC